MSEEINFTERYDSLLNIQPNYGVDRVKRPVKWNYVGLEIEIAVNYERERYTFIRTLLKKVIKCVGSNGYFVKDGTIKGDYSFEIVLDPMSVKKIRRIYSTLMKIISFSDGSMAFDKEHSCGLHMNFNKYDIADIEDAHQRLLMLIRTKEEFFEENIYKRNIYDFDFNKYLNFQKNVADKYISVNYLNPKLVEVRNIKVGLKSSEVENIMCDIIQALFLKKIKLSNENKSQVNFRRLFTKAFTQSESKIIEESIRNGMLIIKLTEDDAVFIESTKKEKTDEAEKVKEVVING